MILPSRYRRELRDRWLAIRLAVRGRVHQYPEIHALRRFLSHFEIDCVIDVGANAGQYATMLRRDCGFHGTILSFEPNPAMLPLLEKAAAGDPRWHIHAMALSDTDGTAGFNVMAAAQFSSLNAPRGDLEPIFAVRNRVEQVVDVKTCRLDGLWPDLKARHGFARPLLKMDTQGHDRAVCDGARTGLAEMVGVQTEMAIRPLYDGATDYRAMVDYLADAGFAPSAFFTNNKGHFPLLTEMDGLFVGRRFLGPADG